MFKKLFKSDDGTEIAIVVNDENSMQPSLPEAANNKMHYAFRVLDGPTHWSKNKLEIENWAEAQSGTYVIMSFNIGEHVLPHTIKTASVK